jgi:low affinity Fe/Cu permease
MSYSSKRTITSVVAGILLIAAYIIYASGSNAPAPEDLKAWATAMLVFIGIGVAAIIVIQIVFHIALAIGIAIKEQERDGKKIERILESSMAEDEREKLIGLKSSRVGYICAGAGAMAMLIALATGVSAVLALQLLFGSFAAGSVVEGIVSVYFYEKGVHHG